MGDTRGMRFRAKLELHGKTATGIEVPADLVKSLGAGKRPPVVVKIGDYSYRNTIASMGGRYLVGVSAEHRAGAGIEAGDMLDVDIEADTAPREVEVPADLAAALAEDSKANETFSALAYSHRKEWVRWVTEAKRPETRASRLAKTVESLRAGKRTR